MAIDPTVTVGNLIEIGTIIVGGAVAIVALRNTVTNMKDDLTDLKVEIKKVADVLVKMAVTDQRLTNAEQDIRDLQHGRGIISHFNGDHPG